MTMAMTFGIYSLNTSQVVAAENSSDPYRLQVEEYVEEMKLSPEDNMVFYEKLMNSEHVNEPFIICHVGDEQQDKVYYYPVSDDEGTIQLMVEAIIIDEVAECNISDNLVDVINSVDYINNEVVVYQYEDAIYVETPKMLLNVLQYYNNSEISLSNSVDSMWNVSFEEKQNAIEVAKENMVEFSPINISKDNSHSEMKMGGDLTLSNPMGQYNYGMCWASCVATVHNYLRSTIITGFEVCTRMGIGYDDGATIYDEQDALALYNIAYDSLRLDSLTWRELKDNIDASKPIIANGMLTTEIGHAVVIYGTVEIIRVTAM